MTSCPACGAPTPPATGFIAFCGACGHRWLNRSVQNHASVESTVFTHDYSGYRPDPAYVRAVTRVIRDELVSRVPPPARLLDVGCGAGEFLVAAQGLGYQVEGLDISKASAEICKSRGLKCAAGDFLTRDFGRKFDIIVLWDVAAHLHEPGAFFARARGLLTPGGLLFVKTPTVGDLSVALASRWPRLAGTLLAAPSHNQYFDRDSLSALFYRTGFEPQWLNTGRARSSSAGGSLKRRLARRFRDGIARLSGDSSAYVAARPAG